MQEGLIKKGLQYVVQFNNFKEALLVVFDKASITITYWGFVQIPNPKY